jgi:hypothetical protein
VYILAEQRDSYALMSEGFAEYREYLESNRTRFPVGAFGLATSTWYYDPQDHRCPHDAWLEAATIEEPAKGERHEVRSTALRIRLLGAYHDGHIELLYSNVVRYELGLAVGRRGHGDWRYDEFRLTESGHLLHEIEWSGAVNTSRWIIEAEDVAFSWQADGSGTTVAVP